MLTNIQVKRIKKKMIDKGIKNNQQLANIIGCSRQAIHLIFAGDNLPYVEAKILLWFKGELEK